MSFIQPLLLLLLSGMISSSEQFSTEKSTTDFSDVIPLSEAIDNGFVVVSFGRAEGVWEHFGQCMQITIKNTTDEMLRTSLDCGYVLQSDSAGVQNMLITEPRLMALRPGFEKSYDLFAMCCQHDNSAPGSHDGFRLSREPDEKLEGIANLIAKYNYHDYAGQNAVWAMSDELSITSIVGDNIEQRERLRHFVAKERGLEYVAEYSDEKRVVLEIPKPPRDQNKLLKGTISYVLYEPATVTVGIFDNTDSLVNAFVQNKDQRAGQHSFEFEISSGRLNNGPYKAAVRSGAVELASVALELGTDHSMPPEE